MLIDSALYKHVYIASQYLCSRISIQAEFGALVCKQVRSAEVSNGIW